MARNTPFIEVRQSGYKELDKAFGKMGRAATRQIINSAMRQSGKPIVKEARANAPKLTGQGAKSIKMRAGFKRPGELVRITIGPAREFFYMIWYEFGFTTRDIPTTPFIRPAWDNNISKFIRNYGKQVGVSLEKKGQKLFALVNKGKISRATRRALSL